MMDWDDVRYFLAVARRRSVRGASEQLGVNHATVLRRIGRLEARLGTRLFDKLPSGYRLTAAGDEVLTPAQAMEQSCGAFETQVFGRDGDVRGALRVTLPPVVATHLLMDDLVDFARLHPEVELEVLSIDEPVNLTNREADVAIRNVYDRANLSENLHGLQGPDVFWGVFMARDLLAGWRAGRVESVRWIIKNRYGLPDWCRGGEVPASEAVFKVTDAAAQVLATQRGLGMTLLPCFVGDGDPSLARVPGCDVRAHGRLWVLTQGETRRTPRVRLFTNFVVRRLASHAFRLQGKQTA